MNCFRYDGTLIGFLCTLGQVIKGRQKIDRIVRTGHEPATGDLFGDEIQIESDRGWAEKVTAGLEKKLGKVYLENLAMAFFSENQGVEQDLIALTRRALHDNGKVLRHLTDPLVQRVNEAALRTRRERHRLYGLLRFVRLEDDCYLASIAPRTNVVPLLGPHFARRFDDQRWVILDTRRQMAIGGSGSRWGLIEKPVILPELNVHHEEHDIAELWRGFYRNISNPDRYNPQLRRQFMPKMYWGYLTEMQPVE